MLTKLEVTNYKSIKLLSLDMQRFMVLVGPNGAGKTNVVRALELLGNILTRGTTAPAREQGWAQIVHREKKPARGGLRLAARFLLNPRQMRLPPRSVPEAPVEAHLSLTLRGKVGDHEVTVVSEEFGLASSQGTMLLSLAGSTWKADYGDDPALWAMVAGYLPPTRPGPSLRDQVKERFNARFGTRDLFEDPTELRLLTRTLGQTFHQVLRHCSISRLRLDASALRSDARFQADGEHALGPSGEGLPVAVDRLRERKDEPAAAFLPILEALREVYPRIEDVVPEPFGQGRVTVGFRERGISDLIPLDSASDGVLHALALLIALRSSSIGVLAIEEPENALHPWSVRKILELAQAQRSRQQVLITTHSETVVNAVEDPASLFIVESTEQGGTTVQPAPSKENALVAILQETGQKLGDVWLDGSLGGVPQA